MKFAYGGGPAIDQLIAVHDIATVAGVKAQEKELELLIDLGPDVPMALVGDSLRLGQVLINLCNNAVKFTNSGEVAIRAESVSKTDQTANRLSCMTAVR